MISSGSLCTGYGGLDMAVAAVLGGDLAWVADNDPGAAAILAHRYPGVPNLGDISAADWSAVEPVDVLTAGFPCQDVSCAGARAGLREGNRTGVWAHVARAIAVLRPPLVVLENVRGLLSAGADSDMEPCPWCLGDAGDEHALRASGAVLGDLASLGYDARWTVVSAADAGAPHRRERVFIAAWPAVVTEGIGWGLGGRQGRQGRQGQQRGMGAAERGARVAEDADRAAGGERREPASGQADSGRPRADAGGSGGVLAAVAGSKRREGAGNPGPGGRPVPVGCLAAHATGNGWDEVGTGADFHGRGGTAERRHSTLRDAANGRLQPVGSGGTDWGAYAAAIARWEHITGRPAPPPTEPGRTGERLSPRFVEFMMGLPDGWVTDVPGLSRNAQLKALGNGVVPQQAEFALRLLLSGVSAKAGCVQSA